MTRRAVGVWAVVLACVVCARTRGEDALPEVFVHGDKIQGVHGIVAGPDGQLYVGSVVGQSIYKVDPKTGAASVWQGPPLGTCDDLVFAPDGRLVWTTMGLGKLCARAGNGPVQELATGLPGMNALAFTKDGRLFASQVFLGDALYEFDPAGKKPPREVMKGMGGLNGFEFGPDGLLYGPLWFKGQVVKIDVDTATLTVVADGFATPAAVNFGPDKQLYVLDSPKGELVRVDPATGKKTKVAMLRPGLDNLCFDVHGHLYVTAMAEAAVFEVDPQTGKTRTIRESSIVSPADLAVFDNTLYVADVFALRSIDLETREVRTISRVPTLEYASRVDASERFVHTASRFNAAVQTFDRKTGALVRTYPKLPRVDDVLEADDGSLLVLQTLEGTISRLSAEKGEAPVVLAKGLGGATAIARAGAGAVYATVAAGDGLVVRVDLKTGRESGLASGLGLPRGIAVAKDGRLLVIEGISGPVVAIDPKSGEKTVIASGPSLALLKITGVAAGPDGRIYIGSEGGSAIYRLPK